MPKNLLTVAVAEGIDVVVPMMIPGQILASGRQWEATATLVEVNSTIIAPIIGAMISGRE
jgi:hypothetical protein